VKIVAAIYNPPELFPPTLWAVEELSKKAGDVTIVTRNIAVEPWPFRGAVIVVRLGNEMQLSQPLPAHRKAADFFKFYYELKRQVQKAAKSGEVICVAYDSIALFAFYLMRRKLKDRLLWFHSHDVQEVKGLSKLSVSWWAKHYEPNAIKRTRLFTLPSAERLKYYGVDDYKGSIHVVPNYPSKQFLEGLRLPLPQLTDEAAIRLIYQGSISPGHCLEEVMEAMKDNRLELTLIGWCSPDYKAALQALAVKLGLKERVHFADPVPYRKLYAITAAHHIGLAIHKPENIIYSTGGTASNKIYEYVSVGLPVILYDSEHFRKHCGRFKWAAFTDGSPASVRHCIMEIAAAYSEMSTAAKQDFLDTLNYEHTFDDLVKKELST
jgi:glycosyltransferase involved in cell wall biosynthesis